MFNANKYGIMEQTELLNHIAELEAKLIMSERTLLYIISINNFKTINQSEYDRNLKIEIDKAKTKYGL